MSERWWSVASRRPERLVLKLFGHMDDESQGLPALIGLAKEPEILVRLDCNGGRVQTAQEVQRALMAYPGRVVVRIEGIAASAAVLIVCAGRQVQALPDASLMIHAPYIEGGGTARALRAWADNLDRLSAEMARAMATKSGQPAESFLAMLKDGDDHTLTAEAARDLGLVDVILTGAAP